jgi:cytoskeletal protein RodZ
MVTIGKKLEEERLNKNLSIEEVSEATKIKSSFLLSIEKGDYKSLPSPAYALGFVRNYAKYLGMPEVETVALFKREFDAERELAVLPKGLSPENEFSLSKFKFGRVFLISLLILIFLSGFLLYQYRAAIFNPPLSVDTPREGETINAPSVIVKGHTQADSAVIVGDVPAAVDDKGDFRKEISVFPGKTDLRIEVTNRFGRKTSVVRHIDVKAGY